MAKSKSNKKANTTTTNTATTTAPTAEAPAAPKVVLRTYRDTDLEQVEYLYRSTQVPLVYESIRSKLWAFPTWIIWFAVYSALLICVPRAINAFITIPGWAMTLVKLFTTFAWSVVGFATLFIASDRIELQNRIDEAMANDLKDPDLYYLNYKIDEDGKKVRKPESEQVPSHFWVLTLDDEVCGMIGLSCNAQDVEDARSTLPVAWKQFAVAVFELFRLPVPGFLLTQKPNLTKDGKKHTFAHQQIPKTATITRWAVRSELQTCGFSTLLLNRAMTWAQEHDINRVYAMTNECCMAAEQILVKRHGFVIMKRFNHNFFGEYSKLFGCRVNEWMEKNGEKTRKVFKKSE